MTASVLGIDIAKNTFPLHGAAVVAQSKKKVCECDASFSYSQKENEEHKKTNKSKQVNWLSKCDGRIGIIDGASGEHAYTGAALRHDEDADGLHIPETQGF